MSRPPARAPQIGAPHICDLRICEPLIATLVLLIVLLSYGQVLPAPFAPVPEPPALVAAHSPAATQVPVLGVTASPLASAVAAVEPTAVPSATTSLANPSPTAPVPTLTALAGQPVLTPTAEVPPTATVPPQESATPTGEASLVTQEPPLTPTEGPSPTPTETTTPAPSPTPVGTATPGPSPTPVGTVAPAPTASPTPTTAPTATAASSGWNLAQDIIGLWEQVDQDWEYYFDFLADGTVFVAENGARTYRLEGDRTIVIQMPSNAWVLTVRDLSAERLILEGVFGPSDEFHRANGVPNLQQAMIGLWTDPAAEYAPIEFTPGGIAVGEFGRGTYRVVSSSHVLIDCDDPDACSMYREYAQPEDAPLSLRVYEIAGGHMTVLGLAYAEKWTLDRSEGHPTLAADIVGLWEDEFGSTLRFTGAGEVTIDGDTTGSYEVLSETTLWVTRGGIESAWLITELDADTLAYTEMEIYWEEPLAYSRIE